MEAFQAAGANADWKGAPGFYMILTDQPGEKSWPVTGVTYILVYNDQKDVTKIKEMLKYFSWCYSGEGAEKASGLNYVPIPENVVELVKNKWREHIKVDGKAVLK
jgi:phosphate transport system substrate-binding protein